MFLCLILVSCRIRPRVRTLPEEINSVYVPMFINNTYEPGLEEIATRATVEAFLSDGRLEVVPESEADAVVQCVLTDFNNRMSSTESDDFPLMNIMEVGCVVNLFRPKERMEPMNVYDEFTVSRSYVSDARRMTFIAPDDAREDIMNGLGRRVVLEVLTGRFVEPEITPGEQE